MQEIQEDEWLGVRHYFMALFWEKMKSSNEVERKFSQGIFEGFKECMTRDDGDTVCGLTSFLFQPAYVRIYFQRLISTVSYSIYLSPQIPPKRRLMFSCRRINREKMNTK